MERPVVIVVGTRPEAIKMLPVYFACKEQHIPTVLCSTAQHDTLLTEVLDLFDVTPDVNFSVMKPGQDLFHVTSQVLQKAQTFFSQIQPAVVLVQGDTTTTMSAALAAFYLQIPIGHIEAGLRTYDTKNPFPEELNRHMIGIIADFNFVPTYIAAKNLTTEKVAAHKIFYTGNTVVDALNLMQSKLATRTIVPSVEIFNVVETARMLEKKIVLLTVHRRESFGQDIIDIMQGVIDFARGVDDVMIVYPYHPNPHVLAAIQKTGIDQINNIILFNTILYKDMVYLLTKTDFIITDSGGISEEGVALGKPVLVVRKKTERTEAIDVGCVDLIGTNRATVKEKLQALHRKNYLNTKTDLYGDGHAAQKIVAILQEKLFLNRQYVTLDNHVTRQGI